MAHVDWHVKGSGVVTCNCAYGCPCQFNALPTHGWCEAIAGYRIEEGHFGEVSLDGLSVGYIVKWPGPIHHGGGKAQLVIDENADPGQREALNRIMKGEETEPGATMWQVFSTTIDEFHDTVYKPVDLSIDVDGRTATFRVPETIESSSEPIRNPVTGDPHRARIDLPHGFEYSLAEMGSATSKSQGPIALDFENSYAQLAHIHLTQNGVVH